MRTRFLWYTLDEQGEPSEKGFRFEKWTDFAPSLLTDKRKIVKKTQVGESEVSTVFLFLDHNMNLERTHGETPILWETMVFGGPLDQAQTRCGGGRKQAMEMHEAMVNEVKLALHNEKKPT